MPNLTSLTTLKSLTSAYYSTKPLHRQTWVHHSFHRSSITPCKARVCLASGTSSSSSSSSSQLPLSPILYTPASPPSAPAANLLHCHRTSLSETVITQFIHLNLQAASSTQFAQNSNRSPAVAHIEPAHTSNR